jgi:hypothetical protein
VTKRLTRRAAVRVLGGAVAGRSLRVCTAASALRVPVRRIVDSRARCTQEQLHCFWWSIWPETVSNFSRCGIELVASDGTGEIRRSPGSLPIFAGLEHGVINVVVTRQIPLGWAEGRGIAGMTTIWSGYHLCVIALDHAHAHRIPIIAVNTCVHELLHVFLQDIFVSRPTRSRTEQHELRLNWLATRLWLFNDGAGIRKSAEGYLQHLRSGVSRQ